MVPWSDLTTECVRMQGPIESARAKKLPQIFAGVFQEFISRLRIAPRPAVLPSEQLSGGVC